MHIKTRNISLLNYSTYMEFNNNNNHPFICQNKKVLQEQNKFARSRKKTTQNSMY